MSISALRTPHSSLLTPHVKPYVSDFPRSSTHMTSNVVALSDRAAGTKDRILETAEALFMEHGFEATSLRVITTAADVNLAAVNYHFGSKEELFEAVLTRRLDPMNQERLALLTELEQAGAPLPVPCDRILTA